MATPDGPPADLPAAYEAIARLHAELAATQSQLALSRHESSVLRAGRPYRATLAWRQLRGAAGGRARLRALRGLVRELRRQVPKPAAPEPVESPWPVLGAHSPLEELRAVVASRPHDIELRRGLRDALVVAAAEDDRLLEEAIGAAEAVRAAGGGVRDRVVLERLTGARRVLAPGWHPRVPTGFVPAAPEPRAVLHLLPDFGPHAAPPWAGWAAPAEDLVAGRLPVVVTPRPDHEARRGPLEVVGGIPHEVVDLGPHYPYDGPADLVQDDLAWAALQVAARYRPAEVRAAWSPDRHELAALGVTLARTLGARLVLEAVEPSRPVGELRQRAAQSLLELADEVRTRVGAPAADRVG